jgi:hypothetical protein
MFDVFLSYAREDRERARMVASALEAQGWSVWWDRKIVAGQAFDRTIEEQLESARVVVVLWSVHSLRSEWVRNEAATASERKVLVPALLDDVKQPLEFRRRHAANLIAWNGDVTDAEFQTLLQGLTAKCTAPSVSATDVRGVPNAGPPPSARLVAADTTDTRHRMPWRLDSVAFWRRWRSGIVAGLLVLAVALWQFSRAMGPPGEGDAFEVANVQSPSAMASSPTSRPSGAEAAADAPLDSRAVDLASNVGRNVDNPVPVALNTIAKVRLDANEEFYLRLPSPAREIDIVMDMRLVENANSNLIAALSVLDENGGVIGDSVIGFNLIDRGARKTVSYSVRQPVRLGFKLVNRTKPADFWVTIRPAGAPGLVPFFGDTVPQDLQAGRAYTGQLAANESVYYRASLSRGDYQAVLDFARQPRVNSNIIGSLLMSDSAGGNATSLIGFNQIDVSYRRVARFSVSKEGPVIFSAQNKSGVVAYTLRVQPASPEAQ